MASFLYQHLPSVVGVVGAGNLGTQIAQACASKDRSMNEIKDTLHYQARHGTIPHSSIQESMGRIHASLAMEPYKKADFIIEAVTEDEDIKGSVFRRLDQITPVQTLLSSNTSSISITRLAKQTTKPHRVVGMHFTSPISELKIVQLARGMHTSQQTYVAARSLAETLGMQTICSEDRPGFVVYRILMPWINEAFCCLMEATSTAQDIDRGLKLGMGLKLGPLSKADLIGLDTCLNVMKVLHQNLGDKYRPSPLLAQYVNAGFLGVKTGRGVFSYVRDSAGGRTTKKE